MHQGNTAVTHPIYVLDDQKVIASTLSFILQSNGYLAQPFYEARVLLDACATCPPSLVISDVIMPEMDGIELAIVLRQKQPACRILLFSGIASEVDDLPANSRRKGHEFELLVKPVRPDVLLGRVARLLGPAGAHFNEGAVAHRRQRHSDV